MRQWWICLGVIAATACSGPKGTNGTNGTDGTSAPTTGTITGTVTDATLGDALAGVTVSVKTTGGDVLSTTTTDSAGSYSVTAPIGTVALTFDKTYYTSPGNLLVGVLGGISVTANATMAEAASGKPSVSLASAATDVGYGNTTTVTATATDPNGDTLSYAWSNATSPTLGTVSGSGATATVTLPTIAQAFAARSASTGTYPDISGYAYDNDAVGRFGITPITPDTRGTVSVKVTVSDGRGQSASTSIGIDAASVLTGDRNVAIGTRVYLNSGHSGTASWTIVPPSGSTAAFSAGDSTSRTPSFVADVAGQYTVTEGSNTVVIYAGNWKGAISGGSGDTVTPDPNCLGCHNGSYAPDKFTPWAGTNHATKFTRGINGHDSASYGSSCTVCHTVGYDKGVPNNGFDDVAASKSWSFPTTLQASNWDNMVAQYPDVARLANIQCENCHGPQTSDAHTTTANQPWTSPRISYSAEVCATCHASGTGHHNYSEWATSDPTTGYSHSNRAGAQTKAVSTSTNKLNNHCGRCHSAQGYGDYADQLAAGNPGNLTTSSTALATVTAANVEPVTCSACHDAHSAANPSQLRFYGDTPLLAAGFQMYGAGKGALCLTCHNSRNGVVTGGTYLHEDGASNPTGYSAPHQACQGDVFAGHNAYFLGAGTVMTSKHAAITDTCVGCHMVRNPETHVSHGAAAVSTHVFRITDANRGILCSGCHGTDVDGEGIAASVETALASLGAKISSAVKAKMTTARTVTLVAYDSGADLYSASSGFQVDLTANPITGVSIEEIHGQIGFVFTFTNAINVQLVNSDGTPNQTKSLTSFGVQLGSIKDASATPTALFALSGNLVRAGWNYFLVEGDQSKGMHNPTFVNTVLNNTMAKDLSN